MVVCIAEQPQAAGGRDTLYEMCLSAVVRFRPMHKLLQALPDTVLLDIYTTMYNENKTLLSDLCDLDVFLRILKANHNLFNVIRYFQAIADQNINISGMLSTQYIKRCQLVEDKMLDPDDLINHGLRLGGFFNDAGWYTNAITTVSACKRLCEKATKNVYYIRLTLECCHRLLHAQSSYRYFNEAAETYKLSLKLLKETLTDSELNALGLAKPEVLIEIPPPEDNKSNFVLCNGKAHDILRFELNNLVLRLFKEFALLYFLRSNYSDTYRWSMKALELLQPETPNTIAIDVLRLCGKACIMMRKFSWAEILIQQAVVRARSCYGHFHPKYAFTLLDYGFYFLNVDSILNSVTVYEEALGIFNHVYCRKNIQLAIAHEDLSYALYVHEYSSGRFYKAREHINCAIRIMEALLPSDHLMLATTRRVKALILEEIALDSPPGQTFGDLLKESELLHKSALSLSLHAFGEMNVQTAKHYGNLGRLYQSMKRFQEAESMQLRAINIKKKILGDDDYEVGLSLGHLASLYNYHMKKFTSAEELYFRSISISLKSFGDEYSGLEYDYIGLIHVNNELKRPDRVEIYTRLLENWKRAREYSASEQHLDFGQEVEMPIYEIKNDILGDEEDTH